ncbi:MAG: hypothetical protein HYU29_02865 [Chloroflexi bacterium]|nr:hypothetical protein [Chloroflexota bacterium]
MWRDGLTARQVLLLTAVLAFTAAILASCVKPVERSSWGWGRSFVVNVSQIRKIQQVAYFDDDGKRYVIRTSSPDNQLLLFKVVIVNQEVSKALLLVDDDAAYIENLRGDRFIPLDHTKARVEVQESQPEENIYLPFLWGELEVVLNYQVEGWMLFDVPKDVKITRFNWQEADSVTVELAR